MAGVAQVLPSNLSHRTHQGHAFTRHNLRKLYFPFLLMLSEIISLRPPALHNGLNCHSCRCAYPSANEAVSQIEYYIPANSLLADPTVGYVVHCSMCAFILTTCIRSLNEQSSCCKSHNASVEIAGTNGLLLKTLVRLTGNLYGISSSGVSPT